MRRRSNRSSKAPEESVDVVSPRKSKRQSRRRKQSTSESDDEPISSLIEKNVDNIVDCQQDNASEEQLWKVAPSPQSSTEGEIQKLKICLKRPSTSPEKPKRTHKKSFSHHDDEQSEEKSTRRSSRRGRLNPEEDSHSADENDEAVDEKGKLKGKSRSKTDKLNDSESCIDEKSQNTKSDDNISDNVQIDHQTVQSDNINTLTGKGSECIEIQEEIVYEVQDNSTATVNIQNPVTTIVVAEEIIIEETNQSEAESKSAITSENSNESAIHVNPPIPMQTVQIQVVDSDEESEKDRNPNIEVLNKDEAEKEASGVSQEVEATKNGNVYGSEEEGKNESDDTVRKDSKHVELSVKELNDSTNTISIVPDNELDTKPDSLNVTNDEAIKLPDLTPPLMTKNVEMEESFEADCDVTMVDVSPEQSCEYPKFMLTKAIEKDQERDKVVEDIPMYVAPPPRVCVYPKSMLAKNVEKADAKLKIEPARLALTKLPKLITERKRKWGQNSTTKDKLPELNLVTSNLIVEIYPNCKLVGENELKMDIADIGSPSPAKVMAREKRKISIEMPKDTQPESSIPTPEIKLSIENGKGKDNILEHVVRENREKSDQASIIALNRKISIVEDTAAKLKPPPSPAKNPVSAVLFINNLVRPFTLKQLKELLERTGKIVDGGFWTDRIKSKCYAHYESTEDAEATRNALHDVLWPIGNGKKLMIEFSTPEDLELARNPPPIPPLIQLNNSNRAPEPSEKENKEPSRRSGGGSEDQRDLHQRDHREHVKEEEQDRRERRDRRDSGGGGDGQQRRHVREWDVGKGEETRRSRTHSRDRSDRRGTHHSHSRSRRSPSPRDYDKHKPHPNVEEPPPQKLMDDLFLKTKSTPCIYWQALTPEEIALKQQQRLERMAEHQRRLQHSTNSGGLGSGTGYLGSAPQQSRGGGYGGPYFGGRRRY